MKCSNNHEPIAFTGFHCPLCDQIRLNNELTDAIAQTKQEVDSIADQFGLKDQPESVRLLEAKP